MRVHAFLLLLFCFPHTTAQPQTLSFTLPSNYYEYLDVSVSQAQNLSFSVISNVSVYVFTSQAFSTFSQTGSAPSVFSKTGKDVKASVGPLQAGTYYFVVDNEGSHTARVSVWISEEPLSVYLLYHALPAPIGIADYGVDANAYTIKYTEVLGYAHIFSISAYNATPPTNVSKYGASLQLNTVLQVETVSGKSTYWLQNVVDFETNNQTLSYGDNVWNMSSSTSVFSKGALKGSGYISKFGNESVYIYATYFTSYNLPLYITLVTKTSYSAKSVNVQFGYFNGSQNPVWYDNVSLKEQGVVSAYMLVQDYNLTNRGTYYDAELVFGGEGNGEITNFTSLSANLALYYVTNNSVVAPPNLYDFGSDTLEAADDLMTQMQNGVPHVSIGSKSFAPLGALSTQISASSRVSFSSGKASVFVSAWGKPPFNYTIELNGKVVYQVTSFSEFINTSIPVKAGDSVNVFVDGTQLTNTSYTQSVNNTSVFSSGQTQSTTATTADLVIGGAVLLLIVVVTVATPIVLIRRRRSKSL